MLGGGYGTHVQRPDRCCGTDRDIETVARIFLRASAWWRTARPAPPVSSVDMGINTTCVFRFSLLSPPSICRACWHPQQQRAGRLHVYGAGPGNRGNVAVAGEACGTFVVGRSDHPSRCLLPCASLAAHRFAFCASPLGTAAVDRNASSALRRARKTSGVVESDAGWTHHAGNVE